MTSSAGRYCKVRPSALHQQLALDTTRKASLCYQSLGNDGRGEHNCAIMVLVARLTATSFGLP